MFYQQDWFLRQIELMIQAIINLIDKKKAESCNKEEATVRKTVSDLMNGDKICEAENVLFESLGENRNDYAVLLTALDFYNHLNSLGEDYLKEHNFSRQEIKEGLINLCSYYDDVEIKKLAQSFELDRLMDDMTKG